jgi:hypothetical protein
MHRAGRKAAGLTAILAIAPTAAGCGGRTEYANRPRPPATIVVTASISREAVSVSPRRLGAGPISLIVTNQTGTSQQIRLESADRIGSGPGERQETAPINPRDTATLEAEVAPGRYRVRVLGDGIRGAVLRVGGRRPSAQNDLLQP